MFARLKTLLRPRLWIALLVGVAAAALVWVMPPRPSSTVSLPVPANRQDPDDVTFGLYHISSNARYLITAGRHHDAKDLPKWHVWDRERGFQQSAMPIDVPDAFDHFHYLFSPDETKLAIIASGAGLKQRFVLLYDLASAKVLKKSESTCEHGLFSHEGKLLIVRDRVLRDLETDAEVRRLPEAIEGHVNNQNIGEFAIYRKDQHVMLYSWLNGEHRATHDLVGNMMNIHGMSQDGQVIDAYGWPKGVGPWTAADYRILCSAKLKIQMNFDRPRSPRYYRRSVLSPDGHHLVQVISSSRPTWLPKWWPMAEPGPSALVTHWTSGKQLTEFSNAGDMDFVFSPQGNLFAVSRGDAGIDIYEFPFTKPWLSIASAALLAACGSWSLAWLWSRRRARTASRPGQPISAP